MELREPIFSAVRDGNMPQILNFLDEEGWAVDTLHHRIQGDTPMIWAAFYNRPEILTMLLDRGAFIDQRGQYDGTALYWSVKRGNYAISQELLRRGADVKLTGARMTPLEYLIRSVAPNEVTVALAFALVAHGADVTQVCESGQTLLVVALEGNGASKLWYPYLMQLGGSPETICNKAGDTVLHLMLEQQHFEFVRALIDKVATTGRELSSFVNNEGQTLIHAMCRISESFPDRALLTELIARGVPLMAQDKNGRTALHLALAPAVALDLFDAGATLGFDSQDENLLAVAYNHATKAEAFCRLLLKHGADPQARDVWGRLPYQTCLRAGRFPYILPDDGLPGWIQRLQRDFPVCNRSRPASTDVVSRMRVLVGNDAAWCTGPRDTQPPPDFVIDANNSLSMFERAVIAGDLEVLKLYINLSVPKLVPTGAVDLAKVFEMAAAHGHAHLFPFLFKMGAVPSGILQYANSPNHTTAVHIAASHENRRVLEELVLCGGDINALVPKHGTALHMACELADVERARWLIGLGANVNAAYEDITPIALAAMTGSHPLVDLLVSAGATDSRALFGYSVETALICRNLHRRQPRSRLAQSSKWTLEAVKRLRAADNWKLSPEAKKDTFVAVRACDADLVAAYYALGDLDSVDEHSANDDTPLIVAASLGLTSMVTLLLELGADINLRGQNGETALYASLRREFEHTAVALLHYGADPSIPTYEGWYPLHMAARLGMVHATACLIAVGAPIDAERVDDSSAKKSDGRDEIKATGRTALHEVIDMEVVSGIPRLRLEVDPRISHAAFVSPWTGRGERQQLVVARILLRAGIKRTGVSNLENESDAMCELVKNEPTCDWSPATHAYDVPLYEDHHAMKCVLMLRLCKPDGTEFYPDNAWNLLPLEVLYIVFNALVASRRVYTATPLPVPPNAMLRQTAAQYTLALNDVGNTPADVVMRMSTLEVGVRISDESRPGVTNSPINAKVKEDHDDFKMS